MSRIQELYKAAMLGVANEEELSELMHILGQPDEESESLQLIRNAIMEGYANGQAMPNERLQQIRQAITSLSTGDQPFHEDEVNQVPLTLTADIHSAGTPPVDSLPVHRIDLFKAAWFKYAAVILLVLTGAISYYFFQTFQTSRLVKEVTHATPPPVPNDVLPGSNRAVLTLSDGQKVVLNQLGSDRIKDGTLSIENTYGQLIYKKNSKAAINTMTTPNGGQYKLTLSDGTRVWLNAASSITYPTSFPGNIREVSITGEAYFEVARDNLKPFIVKTYKDEIVVKGTSFNVNSYTDEAGVKTTLLEGVVQINNTLLRPGNAYLAGKVVAADLDKELAWTKGVFNFHHVKLTEAMRQIARWYDVEVGYEVNVEHVELGGEIGRNLTLQQLLDGLQNMDIHFRLRGKMLTVVQ